MWWCPPAGVRCVSAPACDVERHLTPVLRHHRRRHLDPGSRGVAGQSSLLCSAVWPWTKHQADVFKGGPSMVDGR